MGKSGCFWLSFLRLSSSFRRFRTLIIAAVCVLNLLLVFSHVGSSQKLRDRRAESDKYRHTRGLYHVPDVPDAPDAPQDPQDPHSSAVPTRSNVVYITLKSKRMKPANIRGTIRPKLRRKVRRNKEANSAFTHDKVLDLDQRKRDFAPQTSVGELRFKYLDVSHHSDADTDTHIRIYSQKAPPWLSARDVASMRFLADSKVLRVKEVSHGDSAALLLFEAGTGESGSRQRPAVCAGRCGIISSPAETTEVFAFHLDRVLGLNRTLPAVSRSFSFLHDGQPCPVLSWDASLYPEGLAAAAVRLTWAEYQSSLKQRCWSKNTKPRPESGCSSVHHYEWSKLALFDFLLQIHSRLDPSCCGFRPRQQDVCVELGINSECRDQNRIHLTNIIHRGHDPRHLVYTNNKGFFDRNEDNLDFKLLEGIKELPEQALSVLRSRRLREKLLQSLFLDQTYWESQGGRPGIDKLIDVIERRADVLLTYVNAHGIKVVTMNV